MLGLYGPIIFRSGLGGVTTFDQMRKTVSARWSPHEIFLGKPLLEYGGPELIEVEFRMNFIKPVTSDPKLSIVMLQEIMDFAIPLPLIIGKFPMGRGVSLFVLTELEVNPKYFYHSGGMIGAEVGVKLKEYPDQIISRLLSALGGLFKPAGDVAAPTSASVLQPEVRGEVNVGPLERVTSGNQGPELVGGGETTTEELTHSATATPAVSQPNFQGDRPN